jgi:hypothetical protein
MPSLSHLMWCYGMQAARLLDNSVAPVSSTSIPTAASCFIFAKFYCCILSLPHVCLMLFPLNKWCD